MTHYNTDYVNDLSSLGYYNELKGLWCLAPNGINEQSEASKELVGWLVFIGCLLVILGCITYCCCKYRKVINGSQRLGPSSIGDDDEDKNEIDQLFEQLRVEYGMK